MLRILDISVFLWLQSIKSSYINCTAYYLQNWIQHWQFLSLLPLLTNHYLTATFDDWTKKSFYTVTHTNYFIMFLGQNTAQNTVQKCGVCTTSISVSQQFITKHQWLVHSLYGQKYWDTPFFRKEKGTSKLWQQRWKHNSRTYIFFISISVATVLKCMKWLHPYVQIIGVWWLVLGSRSAFKVTPEVFSWD